MHTLQPNDASDDALVEDTHAKWVLGVATVSPLSLATTPVAAWALDIQGVLCPCTDLMMFASPDTETTKTMILTIN
jgi:hypothetical protein